MMADFHFLRPEWFFALIPIAALWMVMRYQSGRGSTWEKSIDSNLLPFLLETTTSKHSKLGQLLAAVGAVLAIVALAGPVVEQTPQPVHEREDALVIVLDLSRSMYATDVKPNRLIRTRRKLLDLLANRTEGVTGLVVYAGDEHLVSPLTDDAKTIAELIPAVSPEIMPVQGSQLAPALEMAHQLFSDAGIASGRILILTDEIRDIARAQSVARSHRNAYPISVLAVGTAEGAPILDPQEGYLRTQSGELVVPKVNLQTMSEFANIAGGRFSPMTLLDTDLDFLLAEQPLEADESFRETDRDFDVWYEEGPWLILLLLPIAAMAFRRGWVWQIALVALLLPPQESHASFWDDLWWNGNQQGQKLLEAQSPAEAATKFTDPAWKATAQYQAADYESAANTFAEIDSADGQYNRGNALAKSGQYETAIEAYEQALEVEPNHEDAAFNKRLVEELLKQQEQQQQDGEGDENQENQDQSDDESKDSENESSEDEQQSENGESQEDQNAQEQDAEEQQEAETDEQQQQEQDATDQQFSESDTEPLSDEEQQALQQWLRKVPDDPGGLLRRKFEMQFQEKLKRGEIQNNDSGSW